jgi:predicted ferric reductase
MSTLWYSVTWDIARAGGITAYLLMAFSVIIGLALSLHFQSARWPRLINNELHNFLSLLGLVFVIIHVLAVWIDPFTKFGWRDVFIPFLSSYHTFWLALGIISLYLGIAIGISAWIRPRIGYQWWRRLHYLTFLLFILVTLHGIMIGSDSKSWWAIALYAGSSLIVGALTTIRIVKSAKAPKRATHPTLAMKQGRT